MGRRDVVARALDPAGFMEDGALGQWVAGAEGAEGVREVSHDDSVGGLTEEKRTDPHVALLRALLTWRPSQSRFLEPLA